MKTMTRLFHQRIFGVIAFLALLGGRGAAQAQTTTLTVTPITWNVIGLDSNNVNVGPNKFPIGARVCNTGGLAATNVSATLVWDTSNTYVNLRSGSLNPISLTSLAASACSDFYFEVEVTRNAAAHNTTRRYHIEVTATNASMVRTPAGRELFVEKLISQNRNSVTQIQFGTNPAALTTVDPAGSLALAVGGEYYVKLFCSTATQGYEQIETFIYFPNTVFQVLEVQTTYSAESSPTLLPPYDKLYGDACVWENDVNSPNYRSCLGTGKAGGTMTIQYKIRILQAPAAPLINPEPLVSLVYDFSGSSYHYNADFGPSARNLGFVDPASVSFSKNFSPDPTVVDGVSVLTFTISNPNPAPMNNVSFSDGFPSGMKVAAVPGAGASGCGTPVFSPTANATSISFSGGTIPAGSASSPSVCTVRVNVTANAAGTYNNESGNLFIDGANTGKKATDSLTVNTAPTGPACTTGLELARWEMGSGSSGTPLAPNVTFKSGKVSTATTAAAFGTGATSTLSATYGNPTPGWSIADAWPKASTGYPNSGASPFFEFTVDTSRFTGVSVSFNYLLRGNWANGQDNAIYTYSAADGGGFSTITPNIAAAKNDPWGSASRAAGATGSATTSFRFNATGAQGSGTSQEFVLDNVSITGCGVPEYPTLTKAFSPNPIAVNATSTLTFTLGNENNVALTGVTFTDSLPAGVQVASTPSASTTCGGTWSPSAGSTSLSFSGGTIPARTGATNGSCTVRVNVTSTTAGPHDNVSGYIYSTQTFTNNTSTGSARATLTAVVPPAIKKLFSPNPILAGGTSTLTFDLSNPNTDNSLGGVAFSDTYPSGVLNTSPSVTTTNTCGGTLTAAAGAGSVSLSGGTLPAGGTCRVTVSVRAASAGTYANTSGNVSHIINSVAVNGNTASDTLQVNNVRPGIGFKKYIGTTSSGPWFDKVLEHRSV